MRVVIIISYWSLLRWCSFFYPVGDRPGTFAVCAWRSHHPVKPTRWSLAAVSTVWLTYATFIHNGTQGNMSNRIAELFLLPNGAVYYHDRIAAEWHCGGFCGDVWYYLRAAFCKGPPSPEAETL